MIHSLIASPGLEVVYITKPIYKNGNETPSLHADSAANKCRSRLGTRPLKRE